VSTSISAKKPRGEAQHAGLRADPSAGAERGGLGLALSGVAYAYESGTTSPRGPSKKSPLLSRFATSGVRRVQRFPHASHEGSPMLGARLPGYLVEVSCVYWASQYRFVRCEFRPRSFRRSLLP
jgi:hypothetical protein